MQHREITRIARKTGLMTAKTAPRPSTRKCVTMSHDKAARAGRRSAAFRRARLARILPPMRHLAFLLAASALLSFAAIAGCAGGDSVEATYAPGSGGLGGAGGTGGSGAGASTASSSHA